jgi:mRNA interferase MazF
MDKRFEQVEKRFEQVDKQLEQVDKQLEQMRNESDRRFEQVDKQLEQMRNESDRRFEVDHPTVIVLPLTTQLIDQAYPLRFRLLAKDNLEKDSDVLCDQLRAISLHRLQSTKLRQLTSAQLIAIEQQVSHILDFSHV